MLFIVETEKKYFKEVLDHLDVDFSKLPLFKYFGWICTTCPYKNNVLTWNDKSGSKCGRFYEEYPKCGTFYKKIWMQSLFHKYRGLPANTGELKYMAWDVMQSFFTLSFPNVKKDNLS